MRTEKQESRRARGIEEGQQEEQRGTRTEDGRNRGTRREDRRNRGTKEGRRGNRGTCHK
jgi:hypothetical protein